MCRFIMRKIFIFFALFFLFCLLSAEEISETVKEDSKNQEKTCGCNEEKSDKEPDFFYFEPSIGIKTGLPILFSAVLDMSFDFLVYSREQRPNIYLGLNLGLRYSPFGDAINDDEDTTRLDFPFQARISFDFKRNRRHVDYVSFWLSGGANLMWWQETHWIWENHADIKATESFWAVTAAYGFGLDLVFKKDVVLKFGFDSYRGIWPEPVVAVGYRF